MRPGTTEPRSIYTVGFLFWKSEVLLVNKNHPKWQAGLWNGVGGKLDSGETIVACMRREFNEEAGIDVPENCWDHYCVELGPTYAVHFYRTVCESKTRPEANHHNDAGEIVAWVPLDELSEYRVVGNLRWLVPLAIDWRKIRVQAVTNDMIGDRPPW